MIVLRVNPIRHNFIRKRIALDYVHVRPMVLVMRHCTGQFTITQLLISNEKDIVDFYPVILQFVERTTKRVLYIAVVFTENEFNIKNRVWFIPISKYIDILKYLIMAGFKKVALRQAI